MFSIKNLLLAAVAVCLSLSSIGCDSIQNQMYKSAIENAIREDALTGSANTFDHVNSMKLVDLSDCPPDFREAYSEHIQAWEEAAEAHAAKEKLDSEEDAAALGGILTSISGSDATPWADHVQAEKRVVELGRKASADVSSTWQNVEDMAFKYGVQMQSSANQ